MVAENVQPRRQQVTLRAGDGRPVASVALTPDGGAGVCILDGDGEVIGDLRVNDRGEAVLSLKLRGRHRGLVRIEADKTTLAAFDADEEVVFSYVQRADSRS